jgi:hypothetical protein
MGLVAVGMGLSTNPAHFSFEKCWLNLEILNGRLSGTSVLHAEHDTAQPVDRLRTTASLSSSRTFCWKSAHFDRYCLEQMSKLPASMASRSLRSACADLL